MNRYLISLSALALAGACGSALAQDKDAFFVNAGVGQASYHVDEATGGDYAQDDTDTAATLRMGYLWHGPVDFGVKAATSTWAS